MICLDSSFLVDYLRGRDYTQAFLKEVGAEVSVVVPTIVLHELYTGALRKTGRSIEDVDEALVGIDVVGFDAGAAAESADIRATLLDRGEPINRLDMLIAGVARQVGATVVAVDRDYDRVPDLDVTDPRF